MNVLMDNEMAKGPIVVTIVKNWFIGRPVDKTASFPLSARGTMFQSKTKDGVKACFSEPEGGMKKGKALGYSFLNGELIFSWLQR